MNTKRFVIFALTLCLMLCLCACGGDAGDTAAATTEGKAPVNTVTKPTEKPTEPDTKVDYTVQVVDPNGQPVEGVKIEMCVSGENGMCLRPATTDAQGKVLITAEENDYDVKVDNLPENLQKPVVPDHFYIGGEKELTIKLNYKTYEYAVTVTDEGGNPVSLVKIQLKGEKTRDDTTGEKGTFQGTFLESFDSVVVTEAPEGYAADATEYTFTYNEEKELYEVSIVLKAVA